MAGLGVRRRGEGLPALPVSPLIMVRLVGFCWADLLGPDWNPQEQSQGADVVRWSTHALHCFVVCFPNTVFSNRPKSRTDFTGDIPEGEQELRAWPGLSTNLPSGRGLPDVYWDEMISRIHLYPKQPHRDKASGGQAFNLLSKPVFPPFFFSA